MATGRLAREGPILRSIKFVALCVVTAVAWAPVGALLLVALLTWAFDCRVDEGSVHPCSAAGINIGPVLYGLGMSGWLILGLWPVMILTVLIWCGLLVWAIARRFIRVRN